MHVSSCLAGRLAMCRLVVSSSDIFEPVELAVALLYHRTSLQDVEGSKMNGTRNSSFDRLCKPRRPVAIVE